MISNENHMSIHAIPLSLGSTLLCSNLFYTIENNTYSSAVRVTDPYRSQCF